MNPTFPLLVAFLSHTQIHASTWHQLHELSWILLPKHVTIEYTHSKISRRNREMCSRSETKGDLVKDLNWLPVEIPICSQFFKRGEERETRWRKKGIEVETESPWGLRRHYTPRLSADAPKTILNSRKSCEGPLSFANSLPSSRSFRLPLAKGAHIIPLPLPPWSFDPPPRLRNSRERKTKTIVWSFPPSGRATFLRPLSFENSLVLTMSSMKFHNISSSSFSCLSLWRRWRKVFQNYEIVKIVCFLISHDGGWWRISRELSNFLKRSFSWYFTFNNDKKKKILSVLLSSQNLSPLLDD